ncbi:MAG: response regulator [Gammaproteobacteria bacterium]|jgi:CheY-like chemotaxis protein/anti-sigma regulatory factor (Ser/Thr protein kinase)|nr:response regulator [Gammaproteobacteria bacterium]MBT4607023.1 response regulator [Thiotrichales bacterium]MBT3471296.1 response regulator [Gammaproteobacteria bacterium]MBT3968661.1 response regulator [Gammaproteobacteria bacterium]MBT4080269.1 response regulator [Gammaproteobacteria bacterium]
MERLLLEHEQETSLEGVRKLRHLLQQTLQATLFQPALINNIRLCFAEAATNLVKHNQPVSNTIQLRFGKDDAGWWLELVDDEGVWDPTIPTAPIVANPDPLEAISGRGISLLHTLCETFHYTTESTSGLNRLHLHWKEEVSKQLPTVLIVEDDKALCELYQLYLEGQFEVLCCNSGIEALTLLPLYPIDLILSDISMPQMGGLELRKQLLEDPDVSLMPFVFLTSSEEEKVENQASSLGIDDFIHKPVTKEQLTHTIQRVLGRNRQIVRQLSDRINQRITATLHPKLPPQLHGWKLATASRNTGIGGGDLLLYQSSPSQTLITLTDIMGHDDTAKFFAYAYGGLLRGLMQTIALKHHPGPLLDALSEAALEDELLSQITLTSVAVTLSEQGQISIACAGHPTPLKISKHGIQTVHVGGVLPGLIANVEYASTTLTLHPGERIALFTDGLFESAPSEAQRKHLEEQIRFSLHDTLRLPIEQAIEQVMTIFDQIAGTPPNDDTLLLLLEPIEKEEGNGEPTGPAG